MVQSAAAQGLQSSVSEPEFVPYVEDLQLFEQPDLSPYGRGVQPPQGWFGSVEYINLTVGAPGDSAPPHIPHEGLNLGIVVSGPEEVRRVVRTLIKYGVDSIKLNLSGEEITGMKAEETPMSEEEVAMAVQEARARGIVLARPMARFGVARNQCPGVSDVSGWMSRETLSGQHDLTLVRVPLRGVRTPLRNVMSVVHRPKPCQSLRSNRSVPVTPTRCHVSWNR